MNDNNAAIHNLKLSLTTAILFVLGTIVANGQTIEQQIQDSLSKNKQYKKLMTTARVHEPEIKALELKINEVDNRIAEMKKAHYEQTTKQITHQSLLGKYFTPKQIQQINQELSEFGEFSLLTPKSTLSDLHELLVKFGVNTKQLPLTGRAIVKSKYDKFDLRYLTAWVFMDTDINYMFQRYQKLLKILNANPDTFDFKQLCALANEYRHKCEALALAKEQAIILRNSIENYYKSKNK